MATNAASEQMTAGEEGKRERSTIEFPYMGLEDAVVIARGIHSTTGSHTCQHDQLAAAVGMSMNSSGYRMRLSAARLFGFIESDRSGGGVRLTELGQMVVDSTRTEGPEHPHQRTRPRLHTGYRSGAPAKGRDWHPSPLSLPFPESALLHRMK